MVRRAGVERPAAGKLLGDGDGLLTLQEIVDEMVTLYRSKDWPAGHRCTSEGPNRCTHTDLTLRPLLLRVLDLGMRGTEAIAPPGTSGGRPSGPKGSPAPWASVPVEFVDEVYHAAAVFSRQLRAALDLGPLYVHRAWIYPDPPEGWHSPLALPKPRAVTTRASRTPIDVLGPAALRDLPLLVELLTEQDSTDRLVAGPLIDPRHPDRGRRWGLVEASVRRWHRQALDITGHRDRPTILRKRYNPIGGQHHPGPVCGVILREHTPAVTLVPGEVVVDGQVWWEDGWDCGHSSCRRIFMSRQKKWAAISCPLCGAEGLRQDPDTGEVHCDRPRCTDPATGRRPSWSARVFTREFEEATRADD